MGTGSALYRIILVLHLAAAIVGLGGMVAHGAYHARAFRSSAAEAVTLLTTTRGVTRIAEYAVYAIAPLGIVLVAVSDDAFSMGDPWVSASFVVWFLLIGAQHGAVRPAVKGLLTRADALAAAPADPAAVAPLAENAEAMAAARRLMPGEAATQLLMVAALALMVWKPGG